MTDLNTDIKESKKLELKHPIWFLLIALFIAIFFDQITWRKQNGLQLLITVVLVLVGGLILIAIEKKHIPWQSYLLLLPILFGGAMNTLRLDGLTNFANLVLVLLCLMMLATTVLNGQWLMFRLREHLMGFLRLVASVLIDPIRLVLAMNKPKDSQSTPEQGTGLKQLAPYLRGVLIAVPVLLVLGGLLAGADPIFAKRLASIFDWVKFENLGELIFRTIYVLVLTSCLTGAFVHALTTSEEKRQIEPDEPFFQPFLGKVETLTVLVSVNLLFAAFLIVQFQYFFAGEANISYEGFTYAEYARRGFFELLAVAVISLMLFYGLSMAAKRDTKSEKRLFSTLGILLMLQVGVMLLSAFQRLSLYEAAYGFTQLRTVTHVFMIWLGLSLAIMVVLEAFRQLRRVALALFLIFFGLTLTLNLLNVDAFIAERNIQHASAGNPLDVNYLIWNLTDDGVPVMFEHWSANDVPTEVRDSIGTALVCRSAYRNNGLLPVSWASYHFSRTRAEGLYEVNAEALKAYPLIEKDDGWYVTVNGEEVACHYQYID